MATRTSPVLLSTTLLVVLAAVSCTDVPIDDGRDDSRLFPPRGVIRGTVTYAGPRPCSRNGHIVGSAIMLVFDRRNPPPPSGFATSPVNFVAVPGDVLFANEPRSVGPELFCPSGTAKVTASAPFTIAPLDGGSYQLSAFFDRRGRFWPAFKFRNLPEAGDIGGGFVDVADAAENAANPNYRPVYLPISVGYEQPGTPAGKIPDYAVTDRGYVADNIPVTLGSVIPFTRPYFHPVDDAGSGSDVLGAATPTSANPTGDPLAVPILTMTEDAKILAVPGNPTPQTLAAYQKSFRSVKLQWGVATNEVGPATDDAHPFNLQLSPLPPEGNGGLLVYGRGAPIPENPLVPDLWPQAAFVKLADDPLRGADPQSLVVQGTPGESVVTGKPQRPMVFIQGITLLDDSLARTLQGPVPTVPTTAVLRDHVTVLVRPAATCFDPHNVAAGGLLVTPHFKAKSADPNEPGEKALFDPKGLLKQKALRGIKQGCLPKGRYAISLVYPTGQAWTVPNEMGGCALTEGPVAKEGAIATCVSKPRPVLLSQGARAVLEIVDAEDPAACAAHPVPDACTQL